MKTNEIILKYLAGLLSAEEAHKFEDELKSSPDLQTEFKEIMDKLESLDSDLPGELNSNYFDNLIPRVRSKMELRKSKKVFASIKYLAPAFTILILYFLLPFRSSSSIEEQVRDLNDSSQTELLNLIDESDAAYANSDLIDSAVSEELLNTEIKQLDAQFINTDDLLINLSDEEINNIYNTILNKKLL